MFNILVTTIIVLISFVLIAIIRWQKGTLKKG